MTQSAGGASTGGTFVRPCCAVVVALVVLTALVLPAQAYQPADPPVTEKQLKEVVKKAADEAKANGDIAWILVATGLVFFMVPGLALFYGGMARRKNVLGTMMHSMVALGIVGIQWVAFGYMLAFGVSQSGWIGWQWDLLGLQNITNGSTGHKIFPGTNLPILLHCMYQGMFAIITPALISGAFAERIKFGPYCLFVLLWATLIYAAAAALGLGRG